MFNRFVSLQCDLIYTFFHPLPRDERPGTPLNTLQNKPAGTDMSTFYTVLMALGYTC